MFPRRHRLRSSETIQWVLAEGKRCRSKYMQLVYWLASGKAGADGVSGSAALFTVIVSAKQLRHATERNRLKRRYRALAKKHQQLWPATAAVIMMPRAEGLEAPFAELEKDYLKALPKF